MFIDASAIIAILSGEAEEQRCSDAIAGAKKPITSAIAVLETVLALMRPDKFGTDAPTTEAIVMEFLAANGIAVVDLPPGKHAVSLSTKAVHRYRQGRNGLNLGDCLHYACAKYYRTPILATHDEFRTTDLVTVP